MCSNFVEKNTHFGLGSTSGNIRMSMNGIFERKYTIEVINLNISIL